MGWEEVSQLLSMKRCWTWIDLNYQIALFGVVFP